MKKTKVKYHTILKCQWCKEEVRRCTKCHEYFDYNDIVYCNECMISAHYCKQCEEDLNKSDI